MESQEADKPQPNVQKITESDSEKDQFRKYLEENNVVDTLTQGFLY